MTGRHQIPGFAGLRIALVGPLPPPSGGIANQTVQLAALLRDAGAEVELVQVNPPHPRWVANLRGVRALVRLPCYLWRLWRAAGRAQLLHVMAHSGWSWHLCAAPAIWIGRLRGAGVLVNYRGGEAHAFFARQAALVVPSLRRADALVVPSEFLAGLFRQRGLAAAIVPNVVDLERFGVVTSAPQQPQRQPARAPAVLVARHLEPIYDIGTALRAFALLRATHPLATMLVAGSGPEHARLLQLAERLGITAGVRFCGLLDHAAMAQCYHAADIVLNPSLADNMPNSMLEALASGVPVVSTNVGGVPYLVEDGRHALLVPPGDPAAMACAMRRVLEEHGLAEHMHMAGLQLAHQYAWNQVYPRLLAAYRLALAPPPAPMSTRRRA